MLTFVAGEWPQRTGISTAFSPWRAQEQQFGSNPNRSMVCCSKNDSAAFALERLEPALRIDKRQPQILLTILLKMIPEFAERGLVHGDQTAVHRPEPIATS